MDRARAEFQLGQADGRMGRFVVTPPVFRLGDTLTLSATFDNTGSTSLDGDIIIALQDAAGNLVTELRRAIVGLAPGASHTFATNWLATLAPRDCVALVYAQFGGQTTALSVGARLERTRRCSGTPSPPRRRGFGSSGSSVSGRRYDIDFTPELGVVPFSCVASNLPATPPRNTYQHTPGAPQGFYRLREDW